MTQVSTALLVTRDLFFSSQIEGIARAAGVRLRIVSALPASSDELRCELIIIDLELPALNFDDLARLIQTREVRTVGFGSHVKTHLFDAAKQAGVGQLVTRGQLRDRLPEFFC